MKNIKLYAILFGVVVIIGGIVAKFLNNHSFVSDDLLAKKDTTISQKDAEILTLKRQVFSIQQDLDIANDNKTNAEIVNAKLTKERNEARADAKRTLEAIEHYENNGLMRYFRFDPNGIFKKGCYREVFIKPDNICE